MNVVVRVINLLSKSGKVYRKNLKGREDNIFIIKN